MVRLDWGVGVDSGTMDTCIQSFPNGGAGRCVPLVGNDSVSIAMQETHLRGEIVGYSSASC